MSIKTLLTSIACGLIALAVQPRSAAAADPSLAGSWQFILVRTSPPITPVVKIPGLATFTPDGSVIETDGSEFVPGPASTTPVIKASTPGHGIWQPAPVPGTLYVLYISLVLNPNGSLHARNVTTMMVTLSADGSQFSGSYTTDQVSPSGTTKNISSGSVTGQQIPHNPLP